MKFKKIIGVHTASEDLKSVNPNYGKAPEWNRNCQKCVPTYELRRRGFDVTAKPAQTNEFLTRGGNYTKMFVNPEIVRCTGNVIECIEKTMKEWEGDKARAAIYVIWKNSTRSHVFVAEKEFGKIKFIDPQLALENVEKYFELAEKDYVLFYRMDKLDFTDLINDCCEGVEK